MDMRYIWREKKSYSEKTGRDGPIDRAQTSRAEKGRNLNAGQMKPMTYRINACCYLAWYSALVG